MELYINHTLELIERYHSGERYGDWYEDWDSEINSVSISRQRGHHQYQHEIVTVDYDVAVGDTVYVLYIVYSSGDSFGSSSGNAEIIWVFKDRQVAMDAKKIWDIADENDIVETITDSGKSMKLSNPASGYFENVSSINLETYIVEK